MAARIDFAFLLDKARLGSPLPVPIVAEVDVGSRFSGRALHAARDLERLGVLDTGSTHTWLPRSWLQSLKIYGNPQRTYHKGVGTLCGVVEEDIGIWDVSLSLNGVQVSKSFPVRCLLNPSRQGYAHAVIGQDLLGSWAMYHYARRCRGWLKKEPTGTLATLAWRLYDL